MTTSHSRSRSTHMYPGTYLQPQPTVRPRTTSSNGGSPHSFASNVAVVEGPTALPGQYYGIFLGEPPKGFPSSHFSSEPASPGHSHSTHRSAGTSSGSVYGGSKQDTRSKRSSVAFPTTSAPVKQEPAPRSRRASAVAPAASVRESQTTPPYHVIRVDESAARRASVLPPKVTQPPVMPPSALKRERRSTLSTYSGSSGELPAADLRYLCKFAMGSISECLRRYTNAPLFPRLMKTDDVLSRMHTTLYAMATDPSLLNPVESAEISKHLQRLQALLYAVVAARTSTPDHLSQLETSYRTLLSYYGRLEVSLKIRDVETRINELTFKHNVSQQASIHIHDEAVKLKNDPRVSHSKQRKSLHQSQKELDEMHQERVVLRDHIVQAKNELWTLKQQRDLSGGAKTVRFHQ